VLVERTNRAGAVKRRPCFLLFSPIDTSSSLLLLTSPSRFLLAAQWRCSAGAQSLSSRASFCQEEEPRRTGAAALVRTRMGRESGGTAPCGSAEGGRTALRGHAAGGRPHAQPGRYTARVVYAPCLEAALTRSVDEDIG
jgi:hypothetical protein